MRLFFASMAVLVALLGLVFGVGMLVLWKAQLPPMIALPSAAIFAVVVVLIQYLLGPVLIDWIVQTRWTTTMELGPDFDLWYRQTCQTFRIPPSRFGIIEDQAPNAFTYGNGPWNARVVVTRGVITMLSPEELKAVVAHELGHVKNRDFIFMTVVQALVLLMYSLYIMSRRTARKDSLWIIPVSWIAYQLAYYVSLLISRLREYMADYASAQIMRSGNPLSSALVKIAYGLADSSGTARQASYRPVPTAGQRQPTPQINQNAPAAAGASLYDYSAPKPQVATGMHQDGVSPELMAKLNQIQRDGNIRASGFDMQDQVKKEKEKFSPRSLGAFGIAGTAGVRAAVAWFNGSGGIDTKNFIHAARWELYNPWGRISELMSTHPLTALRIKSLQKLNRVWGVKDEFDLSQVKPATYPRFFLDVLITLMPILILGVAVGGAHLAKVTNPLQYGGIALAAYCLGNLLHAMIVYPSGFFRTKILQLLGEVNVSHVNAKPVVLEGVFTGKLEAGVPWANDFVLQDDTGFVACVYRQPFGLLEALWGWMSSDSFIGKNVTVQGWYRRFGAPMVEIDWFQVHMSADKNRCYLRHFVVVMSILGIALGAFLFYVGAKGGI